MNSERKNYPMKEFRAIFPISPILVIRSGYAKKDHISILAVIQKKYGIYINLGCRFEFRTQKLPYEWISGYFFDFIDFGHQVRVCKKRSHLNISCTSKKYGTYINLGCRFELRTRKLPYERISCNFFDFIDFGHQVRVCKKRSHLSISCNSKNMGLT